MKYSVFTVCMPEYATAKVPGLLKAWGYDGVEWRVTNQQEQEKPSFWKGNRSTILEDGALAQGPEVKKICKEAGIAIMGLGTYCGGDSKRAPYLMETALAMGTKSIRISTPYFDGSKSYNKMWKDAQKEYAKIEKLARKFGVRSSIEMHPNTLTASASASLRFLTPFDPKYVGVIYDVGNQVREGMEHYRAGLEMLGKYLAYVHMKNQLWAKAGKEEDGSTKWVSKAASLKGGQMNLAQFMQVLVGLGYDGWVSIEDFSKGTSKRKLTEGLVYLKSLEARARKERGISPAVR